MTLQSLLSLRRIRPLATVGVSIFTGLLPLHSQSTEHPDHEEPIRLETLHVLSSPLAESTDDFNQPVSIVSRETLLQRTQPTLGETLDGLPGVSSTYFGPGASRPLIRGLGGERIRVLSHGLGTIDASAASPDHAVSIEPALGERVEILRGPATLLYGSSAVGGVVNIIDGHIPTQRATSPLAGSLEARYETGSAGLTSAGSLRAGAGAWALAASGLWRDHEDIDIPSFAEHAHEGEEEPHDEDNPRGTLPNSAIETTNATLGGAWLGENSSFGLSYTRFDSRYGVPGHEHHHEEEEAEEGEAEEHGEVSIDLAQQRWNLRAQHNNEEGFIRQVRLAAAFADYRHNEIEGEEIGTRFDVRGWETRLEALHRPLGELAGALGLHLSEVDFAALGEEAFLPPNRTSQQALFLLEEIPTGPLRWQFGARLETQDFRTLEASTRRRDDHGLSLAAGGIWNIDKSWTIALSLTRNQRLPTAQELVADGAHIATGTYEIGDFNLPKEKSTGIDLEIRRRLVRITGSLGLFASNYDGFIYENPTSETIDELPVFRYVSREVRMHGAEAQLTWHAHDEQGRGLDIFLLADTVRGRTLDDDNNLPRLPPWRTGLGFLSVIGRWTLGADLRHAFAQKHTAPEEEASEGYTLLGAHLAYRLPQGENSLSLFLRGTNLTDAEARPHTSFLKEVAPLPGRSFSIGARWEL